MHKNIGPKRNNDVFSQGCFGLNSTFLCRNAFLIFFGGHYFDFKHGKTPLSFLFWLITYSTTKIYILQQFWRNYPFLGEKMYQKLHIFYLFLCISIGLCSWERNANISKLSTGMIHLFSVFGIPMWQGWYIAKNGTILMK